MRLSKVAREVAAEMVSGTIQTTGKSFVTTAHGTFRLAMQPDSDNSTEAIAHQRMGVSLVVMGDEQELGRFFRTHGLPTTASIQSFKAEVQRRL